MLQTYRVVAFVRSSIRRVVHDVHLCVSYGVSHEMSHPLVNLPREQSVRQTVFDRVDAMRQTVNSRYHRKDGQRRESTTQRNSHFEHLAELLRLLS